MISIESLSELVYLWEESQGNLFCDDLDNLCAEYLRKNHDKLQDNEIWMLIQAQVCLPDEERLWEDIVAKRIQSSMKAQSQVCKSLWMSYLELCGEYIQHNKRTPLLIGQYLHLTYSELNQEELRMFLESPVSHKIARQYILEHPCVWSVKLYIKELKKDIVPFMMQGPQGMVLQCLEQDKELSSKILQHCIEQGAALPVAIKSCLIKNNWSSLQAGASMKKIVSLLKWLGSDWDCCITRQQELELLSSSTRIKNPAKSPCTISLVNEIQLNRLQELFFHLNDFTAMHGEFKKIVQRNFSLFNVPVTHYDNILESQYDFLEYLFKNGFCEVGVGNLTALTACLPLLSVRQEKVFAMFLMDSIVKAPINSLHEWIEECLQIIQPQRTNLYLEYHQLIKKNLRGFTQDKLDMLEKIMLNLQLRKMPPNDSDTTKRKKI